MADIQLYKNVDILSNKTLKVNPECLLTLIKQDGKLACESDEMKCRVLKFLSKWTISDIINELAGLKYSRYPNLMVLILEIDDVEKSIYESTVLDVLFELSKNRTLILQISIKRKNITKFYLKDAKSNAFSEIRRDDNDFRKIGNFQQFFWSFIYGKIENFEETIIKAVPDIKNLLMISCFLRIFELNEEFFLRMVIKCAAKGTKDQLMAALGISNEINTNQMDVFTRIFELKSKIPDLELKSMNHSILSAAVEHSNDEVIKFIIERIPYLMQQLTINHQLRISDELFKSGKHEFVCDLLDFCDFPFPNNFDQSTVNHGRLQKIMEMRENFHKAVKSGIFEDVHRQYKNFCDLKIIYSPKNKSALYQTLYPVKNKQNYLHLKKTYSLQLSEREDISDFLHLSYEKKVSTYANILNSTPVDSKIIDFLVARSTIHTRKENKHRHNEYHKTIRKWYEEINESKFGPELLNVVVSCDKLKIIFDFECEYTNHVDHVVSRTGTMGIAYPLTKRIFIGAKNAEAKIVYKKIRGTIAHELCHYAIYLVFVNQTRPYYRNNKPIAELYGRIIRAMDKWSNDPNQVINDNCEETISRAFRFYGKITANLIPLGIEQEVIVRVPELMAYYFENDVKIQELEEIYVQIINFYKDHVVAEFKNFDYEARKIVMDINEKIGSLRELRKLEHDSVSEIEVFSTQRDLNGLILDRVTIITANIPKLFLYDIYKNLHPNGFGLFDTENVIIDADSLKRESFFDRNEILTVLEEVSRCSSKLNIFIDCTKSVDPDLEKLCDDKNTKLIFVVPDNITDIDSLTEKNNFKSVAKREIKYGWKDLTTKYQNKLMQCKMSLQDRLKISINKLIEIDLFGEHIDGQFLKILVEKQEIVVGKSPITEFDEEFELFQQSRRYLEISSSDQEMKDPSNRRQIISYHNLEDLLELVKTEKYVLLSDKTGVGKTWTMKSFTLALYQKYPLKWVIYVDLKQFIKTFKLQKEQSEFSTFFCENIIKLKIEYEKNIFKYFYRNGRVIILFDGFDEIAPDCADFVANLFKSFEFNTGNQMWISTRDFFEINLKQVLKVKTVYKLDEITEEKSVELIVSIWKLHKMRNIRNAINIKELREKLKIIDNDQDLMNKARNLFRKLMKLDSRSIGYFQLYKILANITKNNPDAAIEFTEYKIYDKFTDSHYEEWCYYKGEIRKEASIKIQNMDNTNFRKFHQNQAIKFLFPEFLDLIEDDDPEFWTIEEIIACGLMTENNGKLYFVHQTFAEFLVADFLTKAIRRKKLEESAVKMLLKVSTNQGYGVILMFLNGALQSDFVANKTGDISKKIAAVIEKDLRVFGNIYHFIIWNLSGLDYLAKFFIIIFKHTNYEKMKQILFENFEKEGNHRNIFSQLVENDSFYSHQLDFLVKILISCFDIDITTHLINNILNKHGIEHFIKMLEKMCYYPFEGKNIFYVISTSQKISIEKFKAFIEIIETNWRDNFINIMKNCNIEGESILHVCVLDNDIEKLKFIWEKLLKKSRLFKDLIYHKTSNRNNQNPGNFWRRHTTILHHAAGCYEEIRYYESLWELLLKSFDNKEEIKDFMLQGDEMGENFIHHLILNKKADKVKFILNAAKESFTSHQFQGLLESKTHNSRNLLHFAIIYTSDLETLQIVWNAFLSLSNFHHCCSDLLEVKQGQVENVIQEAACRSSPEILNLMIADLENCVLSEKIRDLLIFCDKINANLLQIATRVNKNTVVLKVLWKIFRKFFYPFEILNFIKQTDANGKSLLEIAAEISNKEIIELTWDEIKISIKDDEAAENNSQHMSEIDKLIENGIYFENDKMDMKWIQSNIQSKLNLQNDSFQKHISKGKFFKNSSEMEAFLLCKNLEIHEILWNFMLDTFDSKDYLVNFMLFRNIYRSNYFHLLVMSNNMEIIEYTLKIIKQNFNDSQIHKILMSTNGKERNLLQSVAHDLNDLKVYKNLWDIHLRGNRTYEIISHVDIDGNNLLHIAAYRSSLLILELTWDEIKKNITKPEISKLISTSNNLNENIFHLCVKSQDSEKLKFLSTKAIECSINIKELITQKTNKDKDGNEHTILHYAGENCDDIQFHEDLWSFVMTVFEEKTELWIFIVYVYGCGYIHWLLGDRKIEIFKFTLEKIRKFFSENQLNEILRSKNWINYNLLFTATEFLFDLESFKIVWSFFNDLINNEIIAFEIFNERGLYRENLLHFIVCRSSVKIFEFVMTEIKKKLSREKIKILLKDLDVEKKNVLHMAILHNKHLEFHQFLWIIIREYFNSSEIYILIMQLYKNSIDLFHLAVAYGTNEIIEFTFNQIKCSVDHNELLKYLQDNATELLRFRPLKCITDSLAELEI